MTLVNQSLAIGKSQAYFSTTKKTSPLTFRYIRMVGKGNMAKGYGILENNINELSMKLQEIYFDYENKRDLSLILYKNGLFKTLQSADNFLSGSLFGSRRVSFKNLRRYRALVGATE